jgi:colicin import membrane protein
VHQDNLPKAPCEVHITQLPGGAVVSAVAADSCPYDTAGKISVENAVLRSQPLPYKGFEGVFQRNLTMTFSAQ